MQARAQVQVRALVLAYLAWIRAVVAAAAVAVLGSNQVPQPRIHEYSCIHVVFTRGWNTCINTCVQSGGGCVQHVGSITVTTLHLERILPSPSPSPPFFWFVYVLRVVKSLPVASVLAR